MNDKKNDAVSVISVIFGGITGGFFAAVIILFAAQHWSLRMDLLTLVTGTVFAVCLPACLDIFGRYDIPLMAMELVMTGVSWLITLLYAWQVSGNTAALTSMFTVFTTFHLLALIIIILRFRIRKRTLRR